MTPLSDDAKSFLERKHIENLEVLTRIDTNLKNHLASFSKHEEKFDIHVAKDENSFIAHSVRMGRIERNQYIVFGIFVCLQFILNLWIALKK